MKKRKVSTSRFHSPLARRSLIAVAIVVCLLGSSATAESKKQDYALIYGTVWNGDHIAPGVPVKIQRVGDKKPKWQHVSDSRGEFAQRVPTGENDYLVIADVKVPKGTEKPQTKVHVQSNERVDISLHLFK